MNGNRSITTPYCCIEGSLIIGSIMTTPYLCGIDALTIILPNSTRRSEHRLKADCYKQYCNHQKQLRFSSDKLLNSLLIYKLESVEGFGIDSHSIGCHLNLERETPESAPAWRGITLISLLSTSCLYFYDLQLLTYIMLWALGPTRLLVQHTYSCTTLYLYQTHMLTCTAHICLLYKGTYVYSLIMKYNTIIQYF